MKKLLGIVVLGLLWCDVGFANPCDGWSWYHKNEMATFEFENKSDYVAKITSVTIKTQDGKIMHTSPLSWPLYVKPFTKKEYHVIKKDLLWEYAKKASIACTSLTYAMYQLETKPKKKKEKSGAKKLLEKIIGD